MSLEEEHLLVFLYSVWYSIRLHVMKLMHSLYSQVLAVDFWPFFPISAINADGYNLYLVDDLGEVRNSIGTRFFSV